MLEVIEEALIDSFKLLPFLFITYLIMEYIEHKTSKKSKEVIKKSGKFGPAIGSILGIFPQCGFSVSATNLYAARVITLGTLISVYLSTSDEMLPIFISEAVPVSTIFKILGMKLVIGMIAGFLIDFVLRKRKEEERIIEICEEEHCHCEHGIIKSALKHTLNIFLFIGLIPNCAASVILTQLYLQNVISAATMISGLLVGAGVGLAVLFKANKNMKSNLKIIALLYSIGVISGIIIQLIGITF